MANKPNFFNMFVSLPNSTPRNDYIPYVPPIVSAHPILTPGGIPGGGSNQASNDDPMAGLLAFDVQKKIVSPSYPFGFWPVVNDGPTQYTWTFKGYAATIVGGVATVKSPTFITKVLTYLNSPDYYPDGNVGASFVFSLPAWANGFYVEYSSDQPSFGYPGWTASTATSPKNINGPENQSGGVEP